MDGWGVVFLKHRVAGMEIFGDQAPGGGGKMFAVNFIWG